MTVRHWLTILLISSLPFAHPWQGTCFAPRPDREALTLLTTEDHPWAAVNGTICMCLKAWPKRARCGNITPYKRD